MGQTLPQLVRLPAGQGLRLQGPPPKGRNDREDRWAMSPGDSPHVYSLSANISATARNAEST